MCWLGWSTAAALPLLLCLREVASAKLLPLLPAWWLIVRCRCRCGCRSHQPGSGVAAS